MLDVGRWFLPADYLYRYVETLAEHKLNRFRLHLTITRGPAARHRLRQVGLENLDQIQELRRLPRPTRLAGCGWTPLG